LKKGEKKLKADEKRSHRLNMLARFYNSHGKDPELLLQRALMIGVTKATAKDYVSQVVRRYP